MGNACASPGSDSERKANIEIDKELMKQSSLAKNETKILLLGTGESGKTTIIKQVRFSFANGFQDKDELLIYRPIIFGNVISSMNTLAKALLTEGKLDSLPSESMEFAKMMSAPDIAMSSDLNKEVCEAVKHLWGLPLFKERFQNKSDLQLIDSAEYFFNSVDRISDPDWIPTVQDILFSRTRTVGINEIAFKFTGTQMRLVDVGGQRSERRKWIHCFEEVTAIFFITAISEYDQVLREDETTNRMQESMNLFQEISNCDWFSQTPIILFLNKSDLFKEKLPRVSIKTLFTEFTGPNEYEPAVDYVRNQFLALNTLASRKVFNHVTCATDTENVKFVFRAVQSIFLTNSTTQMGFGV